MRGTAPTSSVRSLYFVSYKIYILKWTETMKRSQSHIVVIVIIVIIVIILRFSIFRGNLGTVKGSNVVQGAGTIP